MGLWKPFGIQLVRGLVGLSLGFLLACPSVNFVTMDTSVSISSVCFSSFLMNALEILTDYELVFGGKLIYIMSNT